MDINKPGILHRFLVFVICLLLGLATAANAQDETMQSDKTAGYQNELSSLSHIGEPSDEVPTFSFDFKNMPLKDALQKVADKGNYKLLFNHSFLPDEHYITMQLVEVDLRDAFNQLLKDTHLDFTVADNAYIIILSRLGEEKRVVQQETITGTVVDSSTNETLPGVNISVLGTTTGTSTDSEGAFELTVESLQDTLIFSFVGYQTLEIPINGRTTIDVAMQSQAIAGEELVVVGYGTQRRINLTGAVDQVTSEDLENRPIQNVTQGLQGAMPNVNINMIEGKPIHAPQINIRGTTSIGQGGMLWY